MEMTWFITKFLFVLLSSTACVFTLTVNLNSRHLTTVPSNINTDTTVLILENNDILEVDGDSLQDLTKVAHMNLNHNDLTVFPNISGPADTLSNLHIAHNNLDTIPLEFINKLVKLLYLNLHDNKLTKFPDATNSILSQVYRSMNLFVKFPRLLKGGSNLQRLDIFSNQINSTTAEDFQNLDRLEHLDLKSNELSQVPNLTFVGESLKLLLLSSNDIKEIPTDSFNNLRVLSTLHMSDNGLESFPGNTEISDTTSTLILDRNLFNEIPLLEGYTQLGRLQLIENVITNVSSTDFQGCPNLHQLLLNNNKISIWPNLTIIKETLTHLYLSYNQIEEIDFQQLDTLVNIVYLQLDNNKIKQFRDLPNLKSLGELHIARNYLQALPELTSLGQSIRVLNFDNQKTGCNISNNLLSLFTVPQRFQFSDNQLTQFPDFRGIDTDIAYIYLYRNRIQSIPADLFSFPNRHGYLHISIWGNNIDTLPRLHAPFVTYLDLNVQSNPIVCDNSLAWIHGLPAKRITLYCQYPEALRGRDFNSLELKDISASRVLKGELDESNYLHDGIADTCTTIQKVRVSSPSICSPFPSQLVLELQGYFELQIAFSMEVTVIHTGASCTQDTLLVFSSPGGDPPVACNSSVLGNSWKVDICHLTGNRTTEAEHRMCTFHCETPKPIFISILQTENTVSICDVSYVKLPKIE